MKYYPLEVPLLSANEEEITLAVWLVENGEKVSKGQEIAQLESTKAVEDYLAPQDGYLYYQIEQGAIIKVGNYFAIISETEDSSAVDKIPAPEEDSGEGDGKDKRKWTRKAAILAKKHGIDIESISATGIVQEADVLNYIKQGASAESQVNDLVEDVYRGNVNERVLLLGGGRGAVQVIDAILRGGKQKIAGILDDNEAVHGKTIMGFKILGAISKVHELWKAKAFDALVISFSNALKARAALYEELTAVGIPFTNVIDPSVQIHSNVHLGTGNVIIANCRVGACAKVGNNNFFSAYVNLEHHNLLGNHCTFGPGVFTSSRVQIDDLVKFGTGVFIEPGITIGAESIILSGSILIKNVPEKTLVRKKKSDLEYSQLK